MKQENPKNKYLKLMPDIIKDAPQHIQFKWIAWFKFAEDAANHPLRFFPVDSDEKPEGVDLRGFWDKCRIQIKKYGGSGEQVEEAHANWKIINALKGPKTKLHKGWSIPLKTLSKGAIRDTLDTRKADLIDLFGKYHSIEEVEGIIKNKWQIFISRKQIKDFYTVHTDVIDKKRADFVLRSKEFKLATDTGRMEDLSLLRMHWIRKFEESPSIEVSREIRAIDEQARKEVKGNELKITHQGGIDINMTLQATKTIDDICKNLPINLMIIGMVAAKRGVNPMQIQASLTSSVYHKFNGFSAFRPDSKIPSMQEHVKLYDWTKIKGASNEKFEEAQLVDWEETPEEHITRVEERKEDMMQMLEKMKKMREGEK
jgi:hypothetical protein